MSDKDSQQAIQKQAFDYAWQYFSVHATQRLQCVNFFLIASAFLVSAYGSAVNYNRYGVAAATAALGTAVSYVFYKIERRIRKLIHAAEDPLKQMEREMAEATGNEHIKILLAVEKPTSGAWTYSRVFRSLFACVGLTFLAGVGYALWKYFGSVQPSRPAFTTVLAVLSCVVFLGVGYEMILASFEEKRASALPDAKSWAMILCVLITGCGAMCAAIAIALFTFIVRAP